MKTGSGPAPTSSTPNAPAPWSVCLVAAPMPPSCANSTWRQGNSSPTGSRCRKPSRRSAGTIRTPFWSAPTSGPLTHRIRLPADRQAVASRHATGRCGVDVRRGTHDVIVPAGLRSHTGLRAHLCCPVPSTSSTTERYELRGSELVRIDVPSDASSISMHREWLLIEPRTDWTSGTASYPAGSLLATDYDEFISGARELTVVFEPDAHTCLHQYAWTRDRLLLVTLADVASRVEIVTPGSWDRAAADGHSRGNRKRDRRRRRDWRRVLSGFQRLRQSLTAVARHRRRSAGADQSRAGLLRRRKPHRAAAFRDIQRRHRDPVLRCSIRRDRRARPDPARTATADSRYSYTPGYSPVMGRLWLARGGTYVLANIRGGGEYGPRCNTWWWPAACFGSVGLAILVHKTGYPRAMNHDHEKRRERGPCRGAALPAGANR